eukprot:1357592-Amorphochlora_amoeboformis.AAC.1
MARMYTTRGHTSLPSQPPHSTPLTQKSQISPVRQVSGASSGIGRAAALALDAAGFTVFAGVRKDSDAERLK